MTPITPVKTETALFGGQLAPDTGEAGLTVPFSEIPAISATWLWPGVIPDRTPVLWVAPGGTGKGLAIAAVTALVTTGRPFPGGEPREPAAVILIAPEDDANEDLAFRLRAAGADLALVRNLTYLPDGSQFRLPDNGPELLRAIAETEKSGTRVALVALDPLLSVCGRSIATAAAAHAIMDPLQDVAKETGVAMIISHHTTKNKNIVAGNKALTDAARMVWMVSEAPDDASARDMTVWKSNKSRPDGTIRFRIEGEGEETRAVFNGGGEDPEQPAPGTRASRLRLGSGAKRRRRALVAGLMSEPCAECTAAAGTACEDNGTEISLLGKGASAHTPRISMAILHGRASLDQVLAQFGDRPPAGLGAA